MGANGPEPQRAPGRSQRVRRGGGETVQGSGRGPRARRKRSAPEVVAGPRRRPPAAVRVGRARRSWGSPRVGNAVVSRPGLQRHDRVADLARGVAERARGVSDPIQRGRGSGAQGRGPRMWGGRRDVQGAPAGDPGPRTGSRLPGGRQVGWAECGRGGCPNPLIPLQFRFCPPGPGAAGDQNNYRGIWSCTQLYSPAVSNTA